MNFGREKCVEICHKLQQYVASIPKMSHDEINDDQVLLDKFCHATKVLGGDSCRAIIIALIYVACCSTCNNCSSINSIT